MGFHTGPAGLRRRLVALLLLGCILLGFPFPGFSQSGSDADSGGAATGGADAGGGDAEELSLVSAEEILASRCSRIHENPLHLLFLLPGVLFLVFAVTVRKRSGLLILLVAGVLGTALLDASGERAALVLQRLRQAEQSHAAGRVEEALELFRQAARDLPCNPALEHNLGICYAEGGRFGYAVYHLRRSLEARPADQATRRALAAVERRGGLEGQLPMPVPVNPDVLYVMTLVLANLSLGAAGFALRRKGVRALIVLILLTIAAGISLGFFLGLLQSENRPVGVVVLPEVGLMKIPEDGARASFLLPPGTSLRIRGQAADYYLVETASRFRGWVRSEAILLD